MHHIDSFMKSLAPVPVRNVKIYCNLRLFSFIIVSPPLEVLSVRTVNRVSGLYRRTLFLELEILNMHRMGQHLVIHGMNAGPRWLELEKKKRFFDNAYCSIKTHYALHFPCNIASNCCLPSFVSGSLYLYCSTVVASVCSTFFFSSFETLDVV